MTRGLPVALAAVLIVAAFGAGYLFRSSAVGEHITGDGQALAQSPSPQPSTTPPASPKSGSSARQGKGDKAEIVGVVESLRDRTLILKVTSGRGTSAQQGSTLTVRVDAGAEMLREISLADLKKGDTVTLRGAVENGTYVVRMLIVDR